LSFVVLFLNFFSTKVKNKGYFDNEEIEWNLKHFSGFF
jgi:hypothetical protein